MAFKQDSLGEIIGRFKNKVLLNYLAKFYMPVKEYQERILRLEMK